jgi:hypothetical protein
LRAAFSGLFQAETGQIQAMFRPVVYDGVDVSDGRPADLADSTARAPTANLNEEEKNHEPQTLF